jgi:hypothetical protein
MKTAIILAVTLVLGLILAPSSVSAETLLFGASKTNQFSLTGKTANLWKGQKGIVANWQVDEVSPGLYSYTYQINGKQGQLLNARASKVVVGVSDVSDVTVNGKALAASKIVSRTTSTVLKTGGKKMTISFLSYQMPQSSFLVVKGNKRQAVTTNLAFAAAIAPTTDEPQVVTDPEDDVETQQPIDEPQTAVVPLPMAGWAGLSMLGALGLGKYFRRRHEA